MDSSLIGGTLSVLGTRKPNVIDLSFNSGTGRIVALIDGVNTDPAHPNGYLASDLQFIVIRGFQGHDDIRLSSTIQVPSLIIGDQGNDTVTGGADDDTIVGGPGHDSLEGRSGDDQIDGGPGNETISGSSGDDVLVGGTGRDRLTGGADDDGLSGGVGNDVLDGGDGEDILFGGKGRDSLTGGADSDLFGPTARGGLRVDFTAGTDFDARQPVTTGLFTDPGLRGVRTDQLPGAPAISSNHVSGPIDYSAYTSPPTYGPHNPFWNPTGVYDIVLNDENLVHNLEHGHVWLSYDPALVSINDLLRLRIVVETFGRRGIVLAPRPANTEAIAMASWAHLKTLTDFELTAIVDFILTNRGHAPEGFITP